MNSFFLSVRFPRMRREVPSKARRKGQGCVHRSEHLIPVFFAGFLPLLLVGYGVSHTFTASLRSSKSGSLASRQRGRLSECRFLFCDSHDVFFVGGISLFSGFAHTKRAAGCLCLFLLFCFLLFLLSELYFFVDFDDFSHVHAVVVVAVTAAVVFHVDFLVGVVVLRQFVGVDFFADKDEVRFFYGGGTV